MTLPPLKEPSSSFTAQQQLSQLASFRKCSKPPKIQVSPEYHNPHRWGRQGHGSRALIVVWLITPVTVMSLSERNEHNWLGGSSPSAHFQQRISKHCPSTPGPGLAKEGVSGAGCPRGEDGAVNRNPLPPQLHFLPLHLPAEPPNSHFYLHNSKGISVPSTGRIPPWDGSSEENIPHLPFLTINLPFFCSGGRGLTVCSLRNAGGRSHLLS